MTSDAISSEQYGQRLRIVVPAHGLAVLAVMHRMAFRTDGTGNMLSDRPPGMGKQEHNKGCWNYESLHTSFPYCL
jgi:hypothetical protein